MKDCLVELKGVTKDCGIVKAVDNVNLTVSRGEFLALLGLSGSGKTTILSMMGGFTVPTSGQLIIDGEDVTYTPPALRPTVTVYQGYAPVSAHVRA
jgi:ABC-type Fe3+/spermidine/putrescine transport system ATPase subunit